MTPAAHSEIQSVNAAEPTHHDPTALAAHMDALFLRAALASLDDTGWLRITGEDRVRWLNGMVTNSIQDLAPGHGNYNFLLNAQGRIQGDAYVFSEPAPDAAQAALLLQSSADQMGNLTALLDRFIIMDDVELTDISATRAGLLLAGPEAASQLAALGIAPAGLEPLGIRSTEYKSAAVTLIHAYSPLVPRFELWADTPTIAAITEALQQTGAPMVDAAALEALRLLEGTPLYGTDIRDRDLPQETAPPGSQSRALHFSKGCYLGQEIVERIRSRGQVHRTLSAFRLEGTLPPRGTPLEAEGKQIGEITSAALIPLPGGTFQLALGYARREALELAKLRNQPLNYAGGTATPVTTPFPVPADGPGQSRI